MNDIGSDGYPLDWKQEITQRGFTRSNFSRRYVVKLSVLKTQHSFASASNQPEAATLYDLALWKLAAFIPRKLKPNFPDAFPDIRQSKVDELCPNLNALYAKLARLSQETGEESALRAVALARKPAIAQGGPAPQSYTRLCKQLEAARNASIVNGFRVRDARLNVNFSKLPELVRLASQYETKLSELDAAASQFAQALASHADFYAKLYTTV